jgi:hypothetical protein
MSNLSKAQRKALVQAREQEALDESAAPGGRRIDDPLSWRRLGTPVLVIHEIPAFSHEMTTAWDVRRVGNELCLYLSERAADEPDESPLVHRHVEIEPSRLDHLVANLASARVGVWLPEPLVGFDGSTTSVFFGSDFASASFSWWQEGPSEWKAFTDLVRGALAEFRALRGTES